MTIIEILLPLNWKVMAGFAGGHLARLHSISRSLGLVLVSGRRRSSRIYFVVK